MSKPSLPRGTRDFGPVTMAKRNYIFNHIRTIFQKYGFLPLETPSMEQLSVLTGKYGDEGDQLIFKIINSGNYLDGLPEGLLQEADAKKLLPQIAEKALRYDLTVPFARFVVMNRNELVFPFKRYQMQPVWRADRPQKGRYREFYQCDADVVGTPSLLCEAELVLMADEVLSGLGLNDFSIYINHRKVLSGMAEQIGAPGQEGTLCVAIDKLDKIGWEGVEKELSERGFGLDSVEKLKQILSTDGDNTSLLEHFSKWLEGNAAGMEGINELNHVLETVQKFGLKKAKLVFNPSLARGLSYYTGCIFEIKTHEVAMGSISGGGRYDNLTGVFGWPGNSGVGISFGVDRLYDVLEELQLFPKTTGISTQVLIATFDKESFEYGYYVLAALRDEGVAAELYPEPLKMKKQLDYADGKKIPFVIIIGSDEKQSGLLTFKNMETGEQQKLSLQDILVQLKKVE